MVAKVVIYSAAQCSYCTMAKQFFDRKGVKYEEIRVDLDPAKREEMMQKSRQRTVPQIFINDQSIGGYSDLMALEHVERLDGMLEL